MLAEEKPLLLTKLEVPPPRAHTLARQRLLALAPAAPGTRLLLVSAPAGFGKTTFLSCWSRALAAHGAAVAWVTLDEDDDDPPRFLAYLHAAIARAVALPGDLSETVVAEQLGRSDIAFALTRLINALAAFDRDVVLVLDDYHVISAPAIHTAVTFLLNHLPDRVCLAIGSRADPPLPLARLRAREQLAELRAADLRFTLEDVQALVHAVGDLALAHEQARAIYSYAEGWPAGVQLIAMALRSEPRAPAPPLDGLVARLNGSHGHIFAYLADDVFERQPPHLKAFLLQTSILDRMCAPLCDAILLGRTENQEPRTANQALGSQFSVLGSGESYSRLILEEIERTNLFVIPLDGERRWYRYHHLFRAFLRARLAVEPRLAIAELHRRASAWFERDNILPSAVDHALAAGDFDRAAELIEGVATQVIERGEYAVLDRWLDQIPEATLSARPALCLRAAWAALFGGEVEQIAPLIERAACAWQGDGDRPRRGEVAHLQAHLARLRHAAGETIATAQQALADLADDALTSRAGSVLALGAGQLMSGDLEAAAATLAGAYAQCQAHNFMGMLVALHCLGDLAAARGRLRTAASQYQELIQTVGEHTHWARWAAATRLGDLARERNDLDRALETLHGSLTAAEKSGGAVYLPEGYIALARTLGARQDFSAAEAALDRAAHAARGLRSPVYARQIDSWRARLALARGDLAAAEQWQAAAAGDLAAELGYEREIEALTLARVLIAQGRVDSASQSLTAARNMLECLRQEAEAHGRMGSLIEILALMALADAAAERRAHPPRRLHQALALAAPEGYARIFLDEGAPMAALLRAELPLLSADSPLRAYAQQLLAAFAPHARCDPQHATARWAADTQPVAPVESLSQRELEVLRLIASGASNQAIAAALVISLGTVKSHINHILSKLGARNRTEAVARARELELLDDELHAAAPTPHDSSRVG